MSAATLPILNRPTATSRLQRREGFNPLRSVGLAAAISLHLVLAGLMLTPIAAPQMPEPEEIIGVIFEPVTLKPPPIPPPPPIERPPPRPQAVATAIAPPLEAAPGPTVETASPIDTPAETSGAALDPGPIEAGPALASLRLLDGPPPRYPRQALRDRLEGEVELLILVGADGRPQQVAIARSSGHASLDRAAREHVERRWVFEPMQRSGVAVPAWVRVPLRFSLVKDR